MDAVIDGQIVDIKVLRPGDEPLRRNQMGSGMARMLDEQYRERLATIRAIINERGGTLKAYFMGVRPKDVPQLFRHHLKWNGDARKLRKFHPESHWHITESRDWFTHVSFLCERDLILFRLACS